MRLPGKSVAPSRTIMLYVGEVKVLDHPNVTRVAIGNGQVASATVVQDRQIVLIGDGAGNTVLYIWMRDGSQLAFDITIIPSSHAKVLREIELMLGIESGIRAETSGSQIVLVGEAKTATDVNRLRSVLQMFAREVAAGSLVNQVALMPAGARVVPEELIKVYPEIMIHLDVKVVEVKKRALDRLGIKWAASADGPTFATSGYFYANSPFRGANPNNFPVTSVGRPFVSYLGLATQIASTLNFLEQSGDSWTLAEPRLSCKSGGTSKFRVGGEIPIPVAAAFGATNIVYKEYGVIVEFSPVADETGQVSSKINIEVSEPDTRNSTQGFVAFSQNRTETFASLKDGETLILSGLIREKGQRSKDAVPGLSRLPILGGLFRNKEFDNEQTELVVMVTPRIVSANSSLNQEAIRKGAERADGIREVIKNGLMD
jgi:pilus assembly protein CpaC